MNNRIQKLNRSVMTGVIGMSMLALLVMTGFLVWAFPEKEEGEESFPEDTVQVVPEGVETDVVEMPVEP